MFSETYRRFVALVAAFIVCIGCDRVVKPVPIPIVVDHATSNARLAYVQCPDADAQSIFTVTIQDPHGETHQEIFPLRLETIFSSSYPSHVGGFAAGCGGGGGFNRLCYIETATETSIAVRFRLNSRLGNGDSLQLDEQIWATGERDSIVYLPQNATAVLEFNDPVLR